jgi:cyclohexyl-isocyanide hydratase
MDYNIELVWKTRDIVVSDTKVPVQPTLSFRECRGEVDIMFVGGGTTGTFALMNDNELLDFLSRQAEKARLVTSVCTGSLVLASAGLLQGYDATSHWAFRDLLAMMGARPIDKRVVEDRNRITGAGVTSGIDFGLVLASKLTSPEYAQALQLSLEYDPQPPYRGGSPLKASPAVLKMVSDFYAPYLADARSAASKAHERLASADGGHTQSL